MNSYVPRARALRLYPAPSAPEPPAPPPPKAQPGPTTDSSYRVVSGYPPFVTSRDPQTWCRIMEHVSVLMVSDSPEFLETLVELNTTILAEAAQRGSITAETRDSRAAELAVVVEQTLEARKAGLIERLRRLHFERCCGGGGGGSGSRSSSSSGSGSGSGNADNPQRKESVQENRSVQESGDVQESKDVQESEDVLEEVGV